MAWCKAYVAILNRLGMTHVCDGRTDRRTDRHSGSKMLRFSTLRSQKTFPRNAALNSYRTKQNSAII